MHRLFNPHHTRKIQDLEGWWDVTIETGEKYRLRVPSAWESHPDLVRYRGRASFQRTVRLARPTFARLIAEGVGHTCTVRIDGHQVGSHYNAYTAFACEPVALEAGEHVVTFEIDNTFGPDSALHIPNDYYSYGGITRPVRLELLPETFISQATYSPIANGDGTWGLAVRVRLSSCGPPRSRGAVSVFVEVNEQVHCIANSMVVEGDGSELEALIDANSISPWSPEDPNLYEVRTTVRNAGPNGADLDDLVDRVGFRTVEVHDGRLLLNGAPVEIRGVNRHEDHPHFGCALPVEAMVHDLERIRSLGANAVRTAHYPNDRRFLDLCDELGILVWEENHARGLSSEQMHHPRFMEQSLQVTQELVTDHMNHPSVLIWGLLNECDTTTPETRVMYEKHFELVRAIDSTRPVSYATHMLFKDICLDLADIVSFNTYPRWYHDNDPRENYAAVREWAATAGAAGKPVLITETGAGGIYGFRDPSRDKWTEERQAMIVEEALLAYRDFRDIIGVFLWQFSDIRVSEEAGWPIRRPRTRNNKGLLDEYRRPKLAYDVVRRLWFGEGSN